jgi:hypothetical protein
LHPGWGALIRDNSRRRTSARDIPNERTYFIGLWKKPEARPPF